jgi:hypothetical protein
MKEKIMMLEESRMNKMMTQKELRIQTKMTIKKELKMK